LGSDRQKAGPGRQDYPFPQTVDWAKKNLATDKRSSLFLPSINDEAKKVF
jgi:hypothetical protein